MNVTGTYDSFLGGSNGNHIIVDGSLNVSGSVGSADTRWGSIATLSVAGNVTVSFAGTNFGKVYTTGDSTINNPNIFINGVVTGGTPRTGYDTQSFQYGSFNDMAINHNSHMWVNGFSGTGGVSIRSNTASTGSLTVVLNNASNNSSTGSIGAVYNYIDTYTSKFTAPGAKLGFVMRSCEYDENKNITAYNSASQSFTGNTMYFTGGVDLVSGSLYLNYGATLGADKSHGTLSFNKAEGASIASFGNSNYTVGGTFVFDKITVSEFGGTLEVRFDDKTTFDAIKLSEGGISGTGNINIDFCTASIDDLAKLISDEVSGGIKIISWEVGNASTATFSTLISSFEQDGIVYQFETLAGETGLYAAYVAVPEPAEIAAIFAAFALGFAIYARRK